MRFDELWRAVQPLPAGTTITLAVEHLRAALADGASRLPNDSTSTEEPSPERWLTAEQVGELLQKSPRWCYDHRKALGGHKLTGRCTRFSSRAVERFLERKRT